MFSPQVEAALGYASRRHEGQTRKNVDAPYFTHLVHVALILARAGDDDATLAVALLHDVLEDTTRTLDEQRAVEAEIRATWGDAVADAVCSLSEPKRDPDGARLGWHGRKEAYLTQLRAADRRALRVSAADKLHNLETLLAELELTGAEVWALFTGGPEETLWFYRSVVEVLEAQLGPDDGLVQAVSEGTLRLAARIAEHR